jgi:hypothetical protein
MGISAPPGTAGGSMDETRAYNHRHAIRRDPVSRLGTILLAILVALTLTFGAACGGGNPSPKDIGLPNYQPSTVVSESTGSTVLRTPDPIDKVTAYYVNLVDTGGWQTVSRSITSRSASLVVKKSHQGASISISPGPGSQTLISISTYPT